MNPLQDPAKPTPEPLSKQERGNYRWAMQPLGFSESAYITFMNRYEATVLKLERQLDDCRTFISNHMNESGNVLARTQESD